MLQDYYSILMQTLSRGSIYAITIIYLFASLNAALDHSHKQPTSGCASAKRYPRGFCEMSIRDGHPQNSTDRSASHVSLYSLDPSLFLQIVCVFWVVHFARSNSWFAIGREISLVPQRIHKNVQGFISNTISLYKIAVKFKKKKRFDGRNLWESIQVLAQISNKKTIEWY